MSQETLTSVEGTPIAYWRSGDGPPLVLVHGTVDNHTIWTPAQPALEESFTVYAIDRRGRGASGDGTGYSVKLEVEDLVALVVDAIGGQVDLLGHSYGAICALEAALRTTHVCRLVLYEPPLPVGIIIFTAADIEHIQTLLEAGEREEALIHFGREVVKLPPDVLNQFRADPAWQESVAAVHTLPREMRAVDDYIFDPACFRDLMTPTLLLLGSESPPFLKAASEALDAALPNSRIVVMAGGGHVEMDIGTHLFTTEVLRFLEGS
jgi:pimeloyl-ACP methyl ester carboxylesterase